MEEKKDIQQKQIPNNFYSQFSIFGLDTAQQFKQYQLQTNFHAKLLHSLDEGLKFQEQLDALYTPIIKQQTKYLRSGRIVDEYALSQKDELALKVMAEQQVQNENILKFEFKNCNLNGRLILQIVPPQEGGVNYKQQYEKLQIANLALLDEIKRLDSDNKQIKYKFDNESGNDFHKRGYSNPPFQLSNPYNPNPFFTTREPFQTNRGVEQAGLYDQRSLTKQHLKQFDTLNTQNQNGQINQNQLSNRESLSTSQIRTLNPQVKPPSSVGTSEYDQQFSGNIPYDKRKRYRRTANEIERRFVCWCGKSYGSEGSLNQHKKLKSHFDNNSGINS
ncbi:UNKNOWN [Stylonychia lemnae]|uniref:Uncharacterized protein n=1 Tax=Stylonychia lemnae TaxID=5949 RepID=A0A078A3Z9_STYLE|nr:UNKNOWN [Stylonychia lemnae]|eukprot:CDW75489.1 UNKNOWN [Stylonychia lemnae]